VFRVTVLWLQDILVLLYSASGLWGVWTVVAVAYAETRAD